MCDLIATITVIVASVVSKANWYAISIHRERERENVRKRERQGRWQRERERERTTRILNVTTLVSSRVNRWDNICSRQTRGEQQRVIAEWWMQCKRNYNVVAFGNLMIPRNKTCVYIEDFHICALIKSASRFYQTRMCAVKYAHAKWMLRNFVRTSPVRLAVFCIILFDN